MPRTTPMTGPLTDAYAGELAAARDTTTPMPAGWRVVERAHSLSQPWPWPHVHTHAVMFRLAIRDRDAHEALGQVIRLIVAAPGSTAGRYPTGNTGRARVGVNTPMPIPAGLAEPLTTAGMPPA